MKQAIIKFFREMFAPKGNVSVMRVGFFSIIVYAGILVLCIAVYMIKKTWEINGTIDWAGLSMLLGAIGLFMTPVIAGKVQQKKQEL